MSLSIHTSITKPDYWQYAWRESLASFLDYADEVVVIYGDKGDKELLDSVVVPEGKKLVTAYMYWAEEFSWEEISRHNNYGYSLCTSNWVAKCDMDYVFHEKDKDEFYGKLFDPANENKMALSFEKYTVLNRFKAYNKTKLPFVINKKVYGSKIQYGHSTNEVTAWGYPIVVEGLNLKTLLPYGKSIPQDNIVHTGLKAWNYDNFFKNKEITKESFYRFSRAQQRADMDFNWGFSPEEAYRKFCDMVISRLRKTEDCHNELELDDHPKFIKDKVKNMTAEQFGYENWNIIKERLCEDLNKMTTTNI